MELESKDYLVEWCQSLSLSPSIGEGLLRAANKEYLNNVNYHNINTLQSPSIFLKAMLCSDTDLNECVFVFEPMICLVWGNGRTHTDDSVPFLVTSETVRRGKSVPPRERQGDLLYNLNQVKSPG